MDEDFWRDAWRMGRAAFHEGKPNASLIQYWNKTALPKGTTVIVPFCGKSIDMIWLAEQGHFVIGIEIAEMAVEAFFAENSLRRTVDPESSFSVSRSGRLEIWCGDFFQLPREVIARAHGLFDRGGLIAQPREMRAKYARKLNADLVPSARMLLMCVDYNQSEMPGPPFSVSDLEISDHFSSRFEVERVHEEHLTAVPERFASQGLTTLRRTVHLLKGRQ
ncbi:MAG: thiopurine S-methyltransferase [Hyphomicrobiaceae bacterium]